MIASYALAVDGFVQKDIETGQLEIYETEELAKRSARNGHDVVPITIERITSIPETLRRLSSESRQKNQRGNR